MKYERVAAACFGVSLVASVGLIALYVAGGDAQFEGIFLGGALGGLGAGVLIWATRLLPLDEASEERESLASSESAEIPTDAITRRSLLVRSLGAAGAALGAALSIPVLSLGPQPGRSLFKTAWRPGSRAVDEAGLFVRPGDIPLGGVVTVFPEGEEGSADSQTLIVKVEPDLLELDDERAAWAPEGCVAYSKICTHAGCPVGLYRSEAHELLCPCHQSTFDVLRGAVPVFGPAARALPQLPLEVDDDGYLVALGDFGEPVGPAFWNIHSGDDG